MSWESPEAKEFRKHVEELTEKYDRMQLKAEEDYQREIDKLKRCYEVGKISMEEWERLYRELEEENKERLRKIQQERDKTLWLCILFWMKEIAQVGEGVAYGNQKFERIIHSKFQKRFGKRFKVFEWLMWDAEKEDWTSQGLWVYDTQQNTHIGMSWEQVDDFIKKGVI